MTQTKLTPRTISRDLTDQRFGRLYVIEYAGQFRKNTASYSQWKCLCDCGTTTIVYGRHLIQGGTTSCGCYRRETSGRRMLKHGESRTSGNTPEYRAYYSAKNRCESPTSEHYKSYGGRGIEFRFQSFEEFLNEVGRKPNPYLSLDRIDNNGHYESGNVRWASAQQQKQNQRVNRRSWLTACGKTQTLQQWADETGIPRTTLVTRRLRKWDNDRIVSFPYKPRQCDFK